MLLERSVPRLFFFFVPFVVKTAQEPCFVPCNWGAQ